MIEDNLPPRSEVADIIKADTGVEIAVSCLSHLAKDLGHSWPKSVKGGDKLINKLGTIVLKMAKKEEVTSFELAWLQSNFGA